MLEIYYIKKVTYKSVMWKIEFQYNIKSKISCCLIQIKRSRITLSNDDIIVDARWKQALQ